MNEFEKHFEKLAKTDDASTLWTNWLDWVIDQNLIINHDRKLNFKGNEKMYFQLYQDWIKIVSDELEKGDKYYYDYLGVFYEDVIQSKYKAGTNGQFFTPHDVSKLMSQITVIDESIDKPVINDCACGSGRLLLDAHSFNQNAVLIGQDLDPVACKMAVLNFYIHGVRGSILHQNTLTLECFECWRINNYIHHGLPVPHIELVSEKEAYRFIGLNKDIKSIEINKDNHVIENNDNSLNLSSDYKPKSTGQTTLF